MNYNGITAVKSRVMIKETNCVTFGTVNGVQGCILCETGYLPNSIGVCTPCPQEASCDLTACAEPWAYFNGDTSPTATCSLTASCNIHSNCNPGPAGPSTCADVSGPSGVYTMTL